MALIARRAPPKILVPPVRPSMASIISQEASVTPSVPLALTLTLVSIVRPVLMAVTNAFPLPPVMNVRNPRDY